MTLLSFDVTVRVLWNDVRTCSESQGHGFEIAGGVLVLDQQLSRDGVRERNKQHFKSIQWLLPEVVFKMLFFLKKDTSTLKRYIFY